MNITFCDGMLLQVTLHDNKATVISKQEIGTETIDFYNYFAKYRLSPKEQLLTLSNCPDKEAIEIISGQPLVNQFFLDCINSRTTIYPQSKQSATEEALTYTCNLVQYAFSDLDAAFPSAPVLTIPAHSVLIKRFICSRMRNLKTVKPFSSPTNLQLPLSCWIIKSFWCTR